MQLPNIKATIGEAAYNLSEKVKTAIENNRTNYVINRGCAANAKLGDTFRRETAEKILNKVGEKATKDWSSMHKVQNFILKNADKLSKGAVIGGIAAGVIALAAGIKHLVNKAHNKQ